MPDSVRIKEIHAALGAGQYGVNPMTPQFPRVWNLGMMIHALTMANGLNISPDGTPRTPDKSGSDGLSYVAFEDGDTVSDRYGTHQAGIEYRQLDGELTPCPGYLYDVMTPKLSVNSLTGEPTDLKTGGMIGCSSLYQLHLSALMDMAKGLAIDQSVGVVPTADGKGYATYEGLMDVVTEQLYMQSYGSLMQMRTFINSQKGVAMLQEVLRAVGVAVEPKSFNMTILDTPVCGVYSGVSGASPSLADLFCLILVQLAHLLPQTMALPAVTSSANSPITPDEPPPPDDTVDDNPQEV